MRRSALLAAIRHDLVPRVFEDIQGNQSLRAANYCLNLLVSESGNLAKGINAFNKADFGLEDIPNTGKHALVQQDIAHFRVGVRTQSMECGFGIEIGREHIGAGGRNALITLERLGRMHSCDRDAKSDGQIVTVFQHNAHVAGGQLPAIAVAIDVP